MQTLLVKAEPAIVKVECDKCGYIAYSDTAHELEEFLRYKDTCGYFADFEMTNETYGDGDTITLDLCQKCKWEVLGKYIKVIKGYL